MFIAFGYGELPNSNYIRCLNPPQATQQPLPEQNINRPTSFGLETLICIQNLKHYYYERFEKFQTIFK